MKKFHVVLRRKVAKNLKRIDKKYRKRIIVALIKLEETPYIGKALRGELKGLYSLKVWPYRIIYKTYNNKLIVYVIDIGHRQGIYSRFQ